MTIEQKLVSKLGLTSNFQLAVWMLTDGKLVNGSYEGFQRDVDHHEISEFFKPSKRQSPGSSYIYIKKFMNRGNIRMGCSSCGYCVEFTRIPTQAEFNTLQRMMNEAYELHIPVQFSRHSKSNGIIHENPVQFIRYTGRYTNLELTCLNAEIIYEILY